MFIVSTDHEPTIGKPIKSLHVEDQTRVSEESPPGN